MLLAILKLAKSAWTSGRIAECGRSFTRVFRRASRLPRDDTAEYRTVAAEIKRQKKKDANDRISYALLTRSLGVCSIFAPVVTRGT